MAELTPSGVLEDDIVTTIAHPVWRKKNLPTLHISECAQNRCKPVVNENSPPPSDYDAVFLALDSVHANFWNELKKPAN